MRNIISVFIFLLILANASAVQSAQQHINFDDLDKMTGNSKSSASVRVPDSYKLGYAKFEALIAKDKQSQGYAKEWTKSHPYCGHSDTCFQVVSNDGSRTKIKCTKGSYTGNQREVCMNQKGDWASGCGLTDAFAFHYSSLKEAGNKACE